MPKRKKKSGVRSQRLYFHGRLVAFTAMAFGILSPFGASAANESGYFSVLASGAKRDGATDDTAAIQKSLNESEKSGGCVQVPPGRYLVKGSLRIPANVTLQGIAESPVWSEPLRGS